MSAHKKLALLSAAGLFLVCFCFALIFSQYGSAGTIFAAAKKRFVKAALTSVTLNNGTSNVVTGFDVTSQTTSLSPDTGAYRWTLNGSNLAILQVPFDAGGTISDLSGNALTGNIAGGAAYTNVGCKIGGCLTLDGIDDYVSFGDVSATEGQSALSFGGWIYPTQYAQSPSVFDLRSIFTKGSMNGDDTSTFTSFFQGDGGSGYNFICSVDTTTDFPGLFVNAVTYFPLNTWTHYYCTWSAGQPVRLYVNGVEVGSTSTVNGVTVNTTFPLYVGFSDNGTDDKFLGRIDDVAVFPRQLSAGQVLQMYNDGSAGVGGTTVIKAGETTLGQLWDLYVTPITSAGSIGGATHSSNPALIVAGSPTITGTLDNPDEGSPIISNLTVPGGSIAGYRWLVNGTNLMTLNLPFNSGSTQTDISGYGSDVTVNGATFTTSGCKVGNCLSFDGNDYLQRTLPASMKTAAITLAAWVKPSAIGPGAQNIIAGEPRAANAFGKGVHLYISGGGSVGMNKGSGTGTWIGVGSSMVLSTGNWYFLTGTVESNGTVRLYINGVLQATNTNGLSIDWSDGVAGNYPDPAQLYIGAFKDNALNGGATVPNISFFSGLMDEAQVYGRALSNAEILQLYQDGSANLGGPTRVSQAEHALGETWELIATDFPSGGTVGNSAYIDSATIIAAATTTPGITTPVGSQAGNITISYSCSDTTSLLRDFLVEYSTNAGGSFANATIVSSSSGSVAGSVLSMVACNSGTSNNTFVWNSPADGVGNNSTVQIRITAQYPSGPSATTSSFTVSNGTINTFSSPTTIGVGNTTYDNSTVVCNGTTLTINGPHSFTNLILQNGCTLTHSGPSTSVVTKMTLTIANNFDVQAGSSVNVNGVGFAGGACTSGNLGWTSDGVGGGVAVFPQAQSYGPAHAGRGYNWNGASNTNAYDSITNPTEPGAGGGEWNGCGGNGGGAVIITASAATINGAISANAVNGSGWIGGAGGTVNIQATGMISGSGTINTSGSAGGNNISGGGGRIALIGSTVTVPIANMTNNPGNSSSGEGTIFIKETSDLSHPNGKLYAKGTSAIYGTPVAGSYNFDSIIVSGGGKITLEGASTISDAITLDNGGLELNTTGSSIVTANSVSMSNSALLTHYPTNYTTLQRLKLNVATTFTQDATSSITVVGRGFLGGSCGSNSNLGYTSDGAGGMVAVFPQAQSYGPAHAGRGYNWNGASNTNAYDSVIDPTEPGAGGGEWNGCGGNGGGSLIITAASFTIDGTINANGLNGSGWIGGAGGTINLQATGAISGLGTMTASGTTGGNGISGGGGRIALIGSTVTFPVSSITNSGGDSNAGAGTIFIKETSDLARPNGKLYVKGSAGYYATPVAGSFNFDNITVSGGAKFSLVGASTVSDSITLDNGGLELNTTGSSIVTANSVSMANSALLTHYPTNFTTVQRLKLNVATTFTQDATSSITVNGRGFLGGSCGSNSTLGYTSDGAGGMVAVFPQAQSYGPAHAGRGYNWNGASNTNAYDSVVNPTEPGAGGGEWNGCGGNGGGSLIITAASFTLNGFVNATGLNGSGWIGGAGGTINLQATGSISGSGTMNASGSAGGNNISGGGGRIALIGSTVTFPVANITNSPGTTSAGTGTIFIKETSDALHPNGILYAKGSTAVYGTPTPGSDNYSGITVNGGAKMNLLGAATIADTILLDNGGLQIETTGSQAISVGTVTIQNSGNLTHDGPSTTLQNKINMTVTNAFTVDATSTVNLNNKGFAGTASLGWTSNGSGGGVAAFPQAVAVGAAHGGRGYNWPATSATNTYDSLTNPTEPGAGAGEYNGVGWHGGGAFILTAGSITINGTISANSSSGGGWQGGAGGTINLTTAGLFTGNGTLAVTGGNGNNGMGGGGGRIAVSYGTNTFSGTMTAPGGSNAAAGTIFVKQQSESYGDLTVNNNNNNVSAYTPLYVTGQPATYTFDDLSVINYGRLLIDTPCLGTPALTVLGVTDLSSNGTITNNQSGSCTVTQAAISVVTTTLPAALQNAAYSQAIDSAGGYGPHTFVCRSGGVTVACSTVLPPGLSMNAAGVVSGTPTVVGTTVFTVRATEGSPGSGFDDGDVSITVGNAPTAPTNLFANATDAQACCTTPIVDGSPVFSAIFNDPDTGNTASKYRIQVASDAGFTTLLWDSGASGTSMAATAIGARSGNITYAGSALTMGGTTYYWRIKFWDNVDLEGVFSATSTFTTSTAPTAPSTLYSNDSNAQSGLTNPIGLLAAHPVFSAIFNDPDIGDTATKYRVQVDNNNDFSSLLWDSGASGTNMTTCNQGARCADITFGGADIAQNGALYYWRIKFWDAAGVEGAWSQDPTSTNSFTMGQGGTSIQVQQNQQQAPQPTVPDAPQAAAVEVLGPSSVRFNWVDMSSNEGGFRVITADGNIIADVAAGVTQAELANLNANSRVEGYAVYAYNNVGPSSASTFATVVTAAPFVRPVVRARGGDSVTFFVEPAITSFPVQTAIRFELLVTNSQGLVRTLTSDWVQSNEYTFTGIGPNETVQVRAIARNQGGLQNEPSAYEDLGALSRRFAVTLGVFKKGTDTLPRPLSVNDILFVRMALESVGSDPAESVTINLPLPKYILYRPGTMIVDGRAGTDAPDNQGTVGNQNGVSATWARVEPGERHTISFELAFDTEALKALQAAANPLVSLQASVSFANSDVVYMSPVISVEPDISAEELTVPVETPEPEIEIIENEPVVLPTPIEIGIIEQIIQQEFPSSRSNPSTDNTQPLTTPSTSPVPTLQTGETNTSTDGNSFNVGITGANSRLGLSGSASVKDDSIAFTGTTSEPFTVITLIFNDSVTAIVVSDAQGHWQTFVSAERLGIEPGQDAHVKIEAIAAKGDLRSERVVVGEVEVSRGRSGDITADFETTVSDSPVLTVIKEIQKQAVVVIEKNEPVIKTTLAVSAPVVVASSVPLWGYLPYAPTMLYHLITYAVGYSGRKKRLAMRFYGVAYDSITKQPLALAIIRIYKLESVLNGAASLGAAAATNRKLVTTVVTDKQGRYDALLQPGTYQLEVAKPGYLFPSQIVTSTLDADYEHVYSDSRGLVVEGNEMTIPDVPLDPINAQRQWQLAGGIKKVFMLVQKVGNYIATPILIVGAVSSVAVVAAVPDKFGNWVIAMMYIGLLAMQLKLKPKAQKAWGVVYDIASNAVLPLTALQLIEPASSKVVASRLSDYDGRFTFLPEPGHYVVKASKAGYQQVAEVVDAPQTNRQPLHGEVAIEKAGQVISGDIAMRQG